MKKILIIDDNSDLADITAQILETHGFDVHSYKSGFDVLDVVANNQPDLILMDVHLGSQRGTDICKDLKKFYNIPIVLFTADAAKGKAFEECGADGYIEKPFSMTGLISTVRGFLTGTLKSTA